MKHCNQVKMSVTFWDLRDFASCLGSSSQGMDQNSVNSSPMSVNSPRLLFAASLMGTGGIPSPNIHPLLQSELTVMSKGGKILVLSEWTAGLTVG